MLSYSSIHLLVVLVSLSRGTLLLQTEARVGGGAELLTSRLNLTSRDGDTTVVQGVTHSGSKVLVVEVLRGVMLDKHEHVTAHGFGRKHGLQHETKEVIVVSSDFGLRVEGALLDNLHVELVNNFRGGCLSVSQEASSVILRNVRLLVTSKATSSLESINKLLERWLVELNALVEGACRRSLSPGEHGLSTLDLVAKDLGKAGGGELRKLFRVLEGVNGANIIVVRLVHRQEELFEANLTMNLTLAVTLRLSYVNLEFNVVNLREGEETVDLIELRSAVAVLFGTAGKVLKLLTVEVFDDLAAGSIDLAKLGVLTKADGLLDELRLVRRLRNVHERFTFINGLGKLVVDLVGVLAYELLEANLKSLPLGKALTVCQRTTEVTGLAVREERSDITNGGLDICNGSVKHVNVIANIKSVLDLLLGNKAAALKLASKVSTLSGLLLGDDGLKSQVAHELEQLVFRSTVEHKTTTEANIAEVLLRGSENLADQLFRVVFVLVVVSKVDARVTACKHSICETEGESTTADLNRLEDSGVTKLLDDTASIELIGQLVIVGLDTADVTGCGLSEGIHESRKGLAELCGERDHLATVLELREEFTHALIV
mmetsp:Transcript_13763/g.22374  ORF Transcript_13763/g.22374 Transcript_13763/m.22374 type:complete len:602 (-) Transcript_13763:1714-3519(-)